MSRVCRTRRAGVAARAWGAPAFLFLLAGVASAADALPDGRWSLTLAQARKQIGAKDAPADDVHMVLERSAGAWQPLFSGRELVFGLIEGTDGDGSLRVQMLFDAMSRSNDLLKYARVSALIAYRLKLKAAADGAVEGAWSSPESGSGVLSGRVLPMPAAARPAPAAGEHPRFLLRADQIPALKARAATAWGRSLLPHLDKETFSRSGRAVGLGLLYRITGERAYARRAQELVTQDIVGGWWDVIGPIHDPPHKVMEAVYAWDLIHDACDADFHKRLLALARGHLRYLYNFCDIDRGNGHEHSNWSAQFRSGLGMAALALLADPSDYTEPEPEDSIPTLAAPQGPPPAGLPVLPFDADPKRIAEWLVAGPFDIGLGNDGLAAVGGAARAKVYEGLRFPLKVKARESKEVNDSEGYHLIQMKNARFSWSTIQGDDGQPLTREAEGVFRKLPPEWICSPKTYAGAPGYLDLRVASGYRSYRTFYLAAALKVPAPVSVRIRFQNQQRHDPCVYLAGRKFRVNDAVRLEAGVYPVLHPVTCTSFIGSHGRDEATFHGFSLETLTPERAERILAHRRATHAFQALCAKALAGTPYADFRPRLWLAWARQGCDAWASQAISERGWNIAGDCYTLPSLQALAPFAHAYANATGVALASPGNLGWVLPQELARTVFAEDRAFTPSYGRGGGPFGPMPYARCFSFVEPALQPAVGWGAHKTWTLAQAGKLTAPELVVDELDPLSAAFALLQWPAPDEARSPEGIVPKNIADHQRCGWTFRNRFRDGDDAVTMIAGFIHPGGDWGDAVSGEFRIAGLGAEWAVRGTAASHTRIPANVVQLAEGCPKWFNYREAPGADPARRGDAAAGTAGSALVRLEQRAQNLVIGSRSFLTDYSGACGAPVLVVVQDQLPAIPPPQSKGGRAGGKVPAKPQPAAAPPAPLDPAPVAAPGAPPQNAAGLHRWQLVTDPTHQVALRADGFTLTAANGATLNATVLRPAAVKLWQESVAINTELNYRHNHRGGRLPRTVINVGGTSDFLVVMTVQRGPAPAASLAGDLVSVGRRRLRAAATGPEIAP